MTTTRAVWIALASAVLLAGCHGKDLEEVETTASVAVKTMTLTAAPLEGVVVATGLVAAAPGADSVITAPEPARILELTKAQGDRVRKGDVLVRFEIPSAATDLATRRAEVEQAQARVENAQASSARLTTLVEHGVAARKEMEDAKRELTEARAALTQAEAASQSAAVVQARTVVRAGFDGVVAQRHHNPGDMVEASPADVILRIVDPDRLEVVAAVPVADLRRIAAGRPVRVFVPGSSEADAARVISLPVAIDPAGVSADVRIAFASRTTIPVGTPVRVEIVAEQHASALSVPIEAVIREGEDAFVMLAGADKKAHKRQVQVGLTTATAAELVGGVKAGEQVIVQGQQGLPDGAAIVVSP